MRKQAMSDFVVPLAKLQRLAKGRKIELHFQPLAGPVWARNSVYVRGDERDGYSTCVVSGHGWTMSVALRRALAKSAYLTDKTPQPCSHELLK